MGVICRDFICRGSICRGSIFRGVFVRIRYPSSLIDYLHNYSECDQTAQLVFIATEKAMVELLKEGEF